MFEEKILSCEVQMIGTFVDVYEFAERWSRFSTFQKSALKSNSYVGTLDDFSIHVGYSAPMGNVYRKQIEELVEAGLIEVMNFDKEYYETHCFDDYDFKKNPKKKNTKMFVIPRPFELANLLLSADVSKLPDHRLKGIMVRKSVDRREICKVKRRERYERSKV